MPDKCLETRRKPNGLVYRRYLAEDGSKYTTYEVPASVLRSVGHRKVEEYLAVAMRGQLRRATTRERKAFVAKTLDWKIAAVAHHLGVSDERVRQIRKEIQDISSILTLTC